MSKEIDTALENIVRKFHELCQKNPETGEYNFYVQHFRNETDSIDDAIGELLEDKTGYFEEFALDQMRDEALELILAICQAEYYVTYCAYYDPRRVFPTRDQYITHSIMRAKAARKKMAQHYEQLATYYNKENKNV